MSSVTHIRVYRYQGRPGILSSFLRWPSALEEFSFTSIFSSLTHSFSFQRLFQLLFPQRFHLRRIELGYLNTTQDSAYFFDTSAFPKLECLRVNKADVQGDPTQAALALFRGPNQDTLVLDYPPNEPPYEIPIDTSWLEVFIKTVGAQYETVFPKKKRRILVTYSCFNDKSSRNLSLNEPILKQLNDIMELAWELGIKFSYFELSKEDWELDPSFEKPESAGFGFPDLVPKKNWKNDPACKGLEDYLTWKDIHDLEDGID